MNFFKLLVTVLILLFGSLGGNQLNAKTSLSAYLIGPSFSKHTMETPYWDFNEFHPGAGGELQLSLNRWVLGFHGYYMAEDSNRNESFWTGFTAGYRFGRTDKFWCQPFLLLGGMKKHEYQDGEFSPFAIPVLGVGYKWLGINIAFIPRLSQVTEPLFIFQLKVRVLLK